MSLYNVLTRIDALRADPNEDDEWKGLSDEQRDAFQNYSFEGTADDEDSFSLNDFDTRRLWNILSLTVKAAVKKSQPDIIDPLLESAALKINKDCMSIVNLFDKHVVTSTRDGKDARAMELLHFYGTFHSTEMLRASRHSKAAVSDSSDCSLSIIGNSLVADKIHHNMFTDHDELTFQKFKRFEIGGHRDFTPSLGDLIKSLGLGSLQSKLMEFLPETLHNLKCARSFLSQCPSPSKSLTQTVFLVFLTHLTERMNDCLRSSANVMVVTGMNSVELPVTVSKKYLTLQAEKKNTKYNGGPKNTVVRIKSDLAIIEGSSVNHKTHSVGEQQKDIFIDCKVNVEMKRWQLLANSQNKSPLTQVAAESMARFLMLKERNKDNTKVLYSLLTDCMVLYAVCHEVSHSEYWISRSVNTPEEIVLSICWLYLSSTGKVESNISLWEILGENNEAGDDEQIKEAGSSKHLDSVDETNEFNDTCNETHGHSTPREADEEYEMMLPVFSCEDDEDEEERERWQTMFLMENHRKYGTPLPLTETFLFLHDAREQEGGR